MKKINEYGRSMVEMLGVLAIIGVLSAGGLAGYSKAMHKHRINQTIEIFRHSLQRLEELEHMLWSGVYDIGGTEDAIKYGLFPKEMCNDNTDNTCQLPIGEVYPSFEFSSNYSMFGEYGITLTKGDKIQTCIDFLSQHWEKQTPAGWWTEAPCYDCDGGGFIQVYGADEDIYVYSGTGAYGDTTIPTELTLDNIVSACNNACKGNYCTIYMVFRNFL